MVCTFLSIILLLLLLLLSYSYPAVVVELATWAMSFLHQLKKIKRKWRKKLTREFKSDDCKNDDFVKIEKLELFSLGTGLGGG